MSEIIHQELTKLLRQAGVTGAIELITPPNPVLGDLALACFNLAREQGVKPVEAAIELDKKLETLTKDSPLVAEVVAVGPYLNFFLNGAEAAKLILAEIQKAGALFGSHNSGQGKRYLVEFACPNPLKAFHLGHLKNLITGESVVRVLENAGYEVARVNYQGDVGLHVARALWGIFDWRDRFEAVRPASLKERVEFLGQAYAHGTAHSESGAAAELAVRRYNDIVYQQSDAAVMAVYQEARQWSLDYFDLIYKRLGSRFDRLYFESEMSRRGLELVAQGLDRGIFTKSQGAIIFAGSQYGLHDRVFVNSQGFPTYEAKDLALAEKHFADYNPDKVIHVVGKEQTEYFKVVFKALEFLLPLTAGREQHLVGGFLQLKGDQKMSSRQGNIITGDQLLAEVSERVKTIMAGSARADKIDDALIIKRARGKQASLLSRASADKYPAVLPAVENHRGKTDTPRSWRGEGFILEKVTTAALKYGLLKSNVSADVAFDLEESVSVSGDSGPYLLYVVARLKGILKKADQTTNSALAPGAVAPPEKALLLKLAEYPQATRAAEETLDPSKIAKYLFDLAQKFTAFYEACPVLKAEGAERHFRLELCRATLWAMERGLQLLGIDTVEEM